MEAQQCVMENNIYMESTHDKLCRLAGQAVDEVIKSQNENMSAEELLSTWRETFYVLCNENGFK